MDQKTQSILVLINNLRRMEAFTLGLRLGVEEGNPNAIECAAHYTGIMNYIIDMAGSFTNALKY
jgi:hypothetical protein